MSSRGGGTCSLLACDNAVSHAASCVRRSNPWVWFCAFREKRYSAIVVLSRGIGYRNEKNRFGVFLFVSLILQYPLESSGRMVDVIKVLTALSLLFT